METPSCEIPGMFQGQEGDNQVRPLSPSEAAVKEDLRLRKGNQAQEKMKDTPLPPNPHCQQQEDFVLGFSDSPILESLESVTSVQSLSRVQILATPWTAAHQASLSITNFWSLLKLMSMMPSNHLILCHPLLLPPSIYPSIRVFSSESVLPIRWPKYWNFSFNICPSNEYSGLIFFRIDWFDLLAGQGTLKSLLQHHSSKASILWRFLLVSLEAPKAK